MYIHFFLYRLNISFKLKFFNFIEELVLGKIRFKAFDLGGHQAVRKTWKNYFPQVDGIIYLVDSADPGRLAESKKEFESILNTPELAKVPIVILGNKIDMKTAVSEEELR